MLRSDKNNRYAACSDKAYPKAPTGQFQNFLLLRFENYYEGNLEYQEGKLVTTKKEKEYHGYGLKSIRYTVNKYDGAVSIDTKENWFDLKILIPMREKKLDLESTL